MASDGSKITEINAKILRLDTVFKKAIDVSSNSLNNSDLDNCFKDLKSQFGNVLPKLYMNMIAKTQTNIEVTLCVVDHWAFAQWKTFFLQLSTSYDSYSPTNFELGIIQGHVYSLGYRGKHANIWVSSSQLQLLSSNCCRVSSIIQEYYISH